MSSPTVDTREFLLKNLPGPFKVDASKGQVSNQLDFLRRIEQQYGSTFRVKLYSEDVIIMLGAEANQYVLLDKDQNFAGQRGWERSIGAFFRGSLLVRDFEEHLWIRRIIGQILLSEKFLEAYVNTINALVSRETENLHSVPNFHYYPHVRQLSLNIIIATFLGVQDKRETTQITKALWNIIDACHSWIQYPIPGLSYSKGIKGRRFLVDYFKTLIPKSRMEPNAPWLLNQLFVLGDNGRKMSEPEIIDQLVFLLVAGHSTTAVALAGAVYLLAKHPEWQDRLREESKFLGTQFSYDDLNKLKSYEMLLNEAIRMYPPARGLRRFILRSFDFKDHLIPGETMITISAYYTHFSPKYWTNPDNFDPERFSDERSEHTKVDGAFIPFGGGPHKCLGTKFFMMDGKIILHQLLKRYRLSVPDDYILDFNKVLLHQIPGDDFPLTVTPL